MFNRNTVLILGAGASRPYGFPVSSQLRCLIIGDDVQRAQTLEALGFQDAGAVSTRMQDDFVRCAAGSRDALERIREIFRKSERVSIDAFISGRSNTRDIAELRRITTEMVSSVILHCEREEALLTGNWYQWLLELILRKGPDFSHGILSIVTFNYDRSLEYYLWRSFKYAFGIGDQEAAVMLKRIKFVHVYGLSGRLALPNASEPYDVTQDSVPYGDSNGIFTAAKAMGLANPRTVPEAVSLVRELIRDAHRLIFLGFGFWEDNFDLLFERTGPNLRDHPWYDKSVWASRFLLPETTKMDIDDKTKFPGQPNGPMRWGRRDEDVETFVYTYPLNS